MTLLTKNRLYTSRRPIIVRPETAKPINAFAHFKFCDKKLPGMSHSKLPYESVEVYDEIPKPSVITVSKYPLHKANIKNVEPERNRASSRKSNWLSGHFENKGFLEHPKHRLSYIYITLCYIFFGPQQRSGYFVDRDPPSDESKCDYLDPLDLNLSQLHNIYIAGGNYHSLKQTDALPNNEPTVTTSA
ncbi:hypothetical protein WUBG_00382 [Wuchereria bancrofti]|uniref:Uncharacterized protein n=1 Tax=Wuchereria bancrofti TaxID=6293 RepID=J9FMV6_WUCBA|nr:hypothetical protein WUBG_00382 [Wuchereria bancrofti]